ncbi:hypothetical protein [Niveispirillum sp. KHB5.9]|uniref:hypothetical protein n=1 Tax=Niveispirillum sp. KHB5.9 TaxID=3400269 RepID=UPI003A86F9A9
MIPQTCTDFIIDEETGGEAYYNRFACHPVWPGGVSGITIGVGYDLGQQSAAGFQQDWGTSLPAAAIQALLPVIGVRGGTDAADAQLQALVKGLAGITIPWDVANQVFATDTLPTYEQRTIAAFPGADKLNGLCLGALVSLVYNRGPGLVGPSRTEMQAIHDLIVAGTPAGVPGQFRAMKRLWPSVPGLQKRRDAEADMFQQGLDAGAPVA